MLLVIPAQSLAQAEGGRLDSREKVEEKERSERSERWRRLTYSTEVMVVFPSNIVASALAPTSVMPFFVRLEKGEKEKEEEKEREMDGKRRGGRGEGKERERGLAYIKKRLKMQRILNP